MKIQWHNSWSV